MNSLNGYIVVNDIAGSSAVVSTGNNLLINDLLKFGFQPNAEKLCIDIESDEHRQIIVKYLISKGALFSSGKDWSPEELVKYYKEIGKLNCEFKSISWTAPGVYKIISNP
ncbi:hypothetical protein [Aquitalea sp.]|uniref:hypothetical protein n=1 Tax=Aquitalea sp. TaxID=1872623 RepID=UPI002588ADD4|nr:hypothetical protein [Aquitalea sp.]